MKHPRGPRQAAAILLWAPLLASALQAGVCGGQRVEPLSQPQLQQLLASAVNAVGQQQQPAQQPAQQQVLAPLQPAQVDQLSAAAQQASQLYGSQLQEAVARANRILNQNQHHNLTHLHTAADHTELLRREIVGRAGQLQQIVAGSLDMLKTSSDTIVRRLLEQMNQRLELAKARADKISSEAGGQQQQQLRSDSSPPQPSAATRALATINQGLNNLQTMIGNIVGRLEPVARAQPPGAQLDVAKFRRDLQQLHLQVQAALQQQQRQRQNVSPQ